MDIIRADRKVTRAEAAEMLGLKTFDVLPQTWLDEACLLLRLSAPTKDLIPTDSLYEVLCTGTVWCYDRCKLMGEPMPLTVQTAMLLQTLAELKKQPIPQFDRVLG